MGGIGKSDRAQKCSVGLHDIAVGQNNYYDKVDNKWIRCSDLECFKKQGGKYEPNQKKGRTPQEVFEYRKTLSDLAWTYAKDKSEKENPIEKRETFHVNEEQYKTYLINQLRDRRILASVFYYGILGGKQ